MSVKKGTEIATIDVVLVSIQTYEDGADEIILDTSNKIDVTVATETEDAIKLIVKGRLIAQKPPVTTITGNTIVLTDNVFNDEIVKILQGGTTKTDPVSGAFLGYTPPVAGSDEKGELFKLIAYSAIYNEAAVLVGYEKITYPNCQGTPIAFSSEDGVFRASDYTINSAPANGEPPYDMDIVTELPTVTQTLGELTVVSAAGTTTGYTALTVTPDKYALNSYKYKTAASVTLPEYGEILSTGYTAWNGTDEIAATTGDEIMVIEVDGSNRAVNGGKTTVVAASE